MKNTWSDTILNHGQQTEIDRLKAENKQLKKEKNKSLQEKRHLLFKLLDWIENNIDEDHGVTPLDIEGCLDLYSYVKKALKEIEDGS